MNVKDFDFTVIAGIGLYTTLIVRDPRKEVAALAEKIHRLLRGTK